MITDTLPIDTKFILAGPKGEIVESAIKEAEEEVDKFDSKTRNGARFKFPSPEKLWRDDGDWNTWMVAKGKYSGTWPKRYSSMIWQQLGCRPPESLIAKLGEILSRFANCEQTYTVDVTKNFNWEPGEFGESTGSCWWSEYNHARTGLQSNGGLALRFYDQRGKGKGRCWIYPEGERFFMFNAYHNDGLSLYNMACLLSTYMGLSYKRCRLEVSHAYINSEHGYCVGPVDKIADINTEQYTELDFADEEEDQYECECCGRMHGEDYNWHIIGGDYICEWCFEEHYFCCADCNEDYHVDDSKEGADGKMYCDSCWDNLFVSCVSCGNTVDKDQVIEVDGGLYCEDCAPEECEECGERKDDVKSGLCKDCADAKKDGEK